MISSFATLRRLSASLCSFASLGLCTAPAWSTCLPATSSPFVVQAGLVYAPATGLTWQPCSLGQTFSSGQCSGSPSQLTWAAAAHAADEAGGGWRLPTQSELQSLLLNNCSAPATDTAFFPGAQPGWYWSGSPNGDQGAWFIDFEQGGGAGMTLRSSVAYVRLVRG